MKVKGNRQAGKKERARQTIDLKGYLIMIIDIYEELRILLCSQLMLLSSLIFFEVPKRSRFAWAIIDCLLISSTRKAWHQKYLFYRNND